MSRIHVRPNVDEFIDEMSLSTKRPPGQYEDASFMFIFLHCRHSAEGVGLNFSTKFILISTPAGADLDRLIRFAIEIQFAVCELRTFRGEFDSSNQIRR